MDTNTISIDNLIDKVEERERRARRRAFFYTLVPIIVACVLVIGTGKYLLHAKKTVVQAELEVTEAEKQLNDLNMQANLLNEQAKKAKQEANNLNMQINLLNKQMDKAVDNFIDIAKAVQGIELLIESKKSYLRTIDEARFLINVRMKFDNLNEQLDRLSKVFPAVGDLKSSRNWVTIIKSSKNLESLALASPSWIDKFGESNVAIYESPNGYYALALLTDGSFTKAYRLTVSLQRSGQVTDAYFADVVDWGKNLLK